MKHPYSLLTVCLALSINANAADEKKIEADNTNRNKIDQSGEHKTPTDQSNSAEDIKLAASIRQLVVKDDALSITAKNCKIITIAGAVTLRGPVNTAEEKATIEKYAQQAAGKGKVVSELEVKAAK